MTDERRKAAEKYATSDGEMSKVAMRGMMYETELIASWST